MDVATLRKRSDFDRVFRQGTRTRRGAVVVVRAPGVPGSVRLGLVVGKRVGNAVERNRIKRRLRHAFVESRQREGTDVVVIASHEVLSAPYSDLRRWLGAGADRRHEGKEESKGG